METKIIKNDLFFLEVANGITSGERVRIRAKGNSMLPFIRDAKDQIILEKPNKHSFQKGRLLLVVMKDGNYLMHRVQKVDGIHILLRGDGNLSRLEHCTSSDVIAEATTVLRGGNTIKEGKIIKLGSLRWNLYRYLWPRNLFLRRVCLAIYRRVPIFSS